MVGCATCYLVLIVIVVIKTELVQDPVHDVTTNLGALEEGSEDRQGYKEDAEIEQDDEQSVNVSHSNSAAPTVFSCLSWFCYTDYAYASKSNIIEAHTHIPLYI